MAFTEDPDDFINEDTPGYKVLAVDGVSVGGIFDDYFVEDSFVETSDPTFTAKTSLISSVVHNSTVVDSAAGNNYRVSGVASDGTGFTKLDLRLE